MLNIDNQLLQKLRRRIFSRIRSIKVIASTEKVHEYQVLDYIRNIKFLDLPEVYSLSDYNKKELKRINCKLDAIMPKAQLKNRKSMEISKDNNSLTTRKPDE